MSKQNLKQRSKTNWKRVDAIKDDSIDYSDIPELDDAFFKNAKLELPHKKDSVTLRLDHEIIEWFKKRGKGYQTKINAVLRAYVKAHNH